MDGGLFLLGRRVALHEVWMILVKVDSSTAVEQIVTRFQRLELSTMLYS
jgi:hypothetical protein